MALVNRFNVNSTPATLNKDFINVNLENNHETAYSSSTDARNAVPALHRKAGLQITYLLADGWFVDQYVGSDINDWETDSNWNVTTIIGTDRIVDGAVTINKIGDNVLTSENIIDNLIGKKQAEINQEIRNVNIHNGIDLSLSDENFNEIVQFKKGHIKTKKFDSEIDASASSRGLMSSADKVKLDGIEEGSDKSGVSVSSRNEDSDLALVDENDYDIVRFKNGHVKTKEFDSEVDAPISDGGYHAELSFEDSNGYSCFNVRNGFPYTKKFNGKRIQESYEEYRMRLECSRNNVPYEIKDVLTKEKLTEYINAIDRNMTFVKGFSFIFVTDIHFFNNSGVSKYLIKHLLDNTSLYLAIGGGDYAWAYGGESDLERDARKYIEYVNYIGKDRFITVRGNHDFTIKESANSENGVTKEYGFTYNTLCRPIECANVEIDPENFVWCYTNEAQKIKIIGANSCDTQGEGAWNVRYHVGEAQIKWIIEHIADGYKYVFISHIPTSSALTDSHGVTSQKPLRDLMIAIKNKSSYVYNSISHDFSNLNGEFVCHICGHQHEDAYDENEILEIVTTCDTMESNKTDFRFSFDVFSIDYDNRTIKTVRLGDGENRTFNY